MQNKAWQQEANTARRQQEQATANANVQRSQAEALRTGYEAPMAMYNMEMAKQGAMANLMGNKANVHMGLGGAKAKMWSDIGSGVGKGFMAYGMYKTPSPDTPSPGGGGGDSPFTKDLIFDTSFEDNLRRQQEAEAFIASDIKLKENINHIGNDDATGLPIYDFNYKGDKSRYRGVMAQDVENLIPDAVTSHNGIKYVNYNKLGMKLYKLT
jgi:hypothetical protein